MKKITLNKLLSGLLVILAATSLTVAQKKRPAAKAKAKPIIFAVLNDGKTLEPIANIDKGELIPTAGGDGDAKAITAFTNSYYKPKPIYRLIFGGADDGAATIASFDPTAECSKNMAQITAQPTRAKLKGMVMALATNQPTKKTKGVRRLPTAAERAEIESLVRAEFIKQKLTDNAVVGMKYHNLTALDVDNDGKAELVGSFWATPKADERALLFFIADKGADGKYVFGYSDYKPVKKDEVMSEEIAMLDSGIYNELLLDAYDFDEDGTGEVFTYIQGFEGSSFNAYRRDGGKWTKTFEGSNYHCGY